MLSFKPKTIKKIKVNKKTSTTLDSKHKEYLEEFMLDETERIPKLKKQKAILKNKLKNMNTNTNSDNSSSFTLEQELDIQDKINEIKKCILKLKNKKKEYYLNNVGYIFDYFETKKNISLEEPSLKPIKNSKNEAVNLFFKIKKEEHIGQGEDGEQEREQEEKMETKEESIVQKYLSNVDDFFLNVQEFVNPIDVCRFCHRGELIPLEDEGVLICNNNKCARSVPYLIENEKPSYKEPPKEVCFYAYKRINHFKEVIAQFQGKETTNIPEEVIEKIKLQIIKERIQLSTSLSFQKTKEILKNLGESKLYEHIQFIKHKLGIQPPIFSAELEEKLFNSFAELQTPYSKYCPHYRVNFLNYYFTLYKLLELYGETQYLKEIPMLKNRDKRLEQDTIWKNICQEKNWTFIPTP